jgi:hypothetical protein
MAGLPVFDVADDTVPDPLIAMFDPAIFDFELRTLPTSKEFQNEVSGARYRRRRDSPTDLGIDKSKYPND